MKKNTPVKKEHVWPKKYLHGELLAGLEIMGWGGRRRTRGTRIKWLNDFLIDWLNDGLYGMDEILLFRWIECLIIMRQGAMKSISDN